MRKFLNFLIFFNFFIQIPALWACESCACTIARCGLDREDLKKPFFFDFTMEQQNWDEVDPAEAHELHHEGHHVHDKTHEEFYHTTFGFNPSEEWTILADLPYVVRSMKEVDTHRRVGQSETAEGLGDLKVTATYRFLKNDTAFLGAVGGVKFPTGDTKELDSVGGRFEPEMQPGSGSVDVTMGAAFQAPVGPLRLHGNTLYTFKNKGDQKFEFGDAFTSFLTLDLPVFSQPSGFNIRSGADMNIQIEDKDKADGVKIVDSGGTTVLLGPSLTIDATQHVSFFGNILLPVYQNMGGVHQELDFVWNLGAKIIW